MQTDFLLTKLLDDFYSGIENRTPFFLAFYASDKILNWHFETWKKDLEYLKDVHDTPSGLEIWSKYDQAHRTVNEIFKYIHKRILIDDTYTFTLYKSLTKHAESHKDEEIKVQNHTRYYIEDLILNFSKVFFENFDKLKTNRDIWENFPKDWRIPSNVGEQPSKVQLKILEEFVNWAKERIENVKDEFDWALDDVSRNLFHDVEPSKWAKILLFALTPSDINSRVQKVISKQWTFGFGGRIRVSNSIEEARELSRSLDESETFNTYKLTFSIVFLSRLFTKENLVNFINQAESLKYEVNSSEEHKRQSLLILFKGLENFLKETKNNII